MKKPSARPDRPNILLTGAAGFIGRHLSAYLDGEYNVFNIVRRSGAPRLENAIRLDLAEGRQVSSYFRKFAKRHRIYAIIHLASRMNSAETAQDSSILHDNIKICESVAGIAKALKPRKLVNFSSMAVYPNKDGLYGEASQLGMFGNADCLYGLSKFCGENILDFMLREEKILISHLRVSQVYGDGMRQDRIMPAMRRELQDKNTITVFGGGRRISDFVHVKKLLPIIVELFIRKDISGVFNIGDESLSYLKLAQRIARQYGNKKSRIIMRPKGCTAQFRLDTSKIKRLQNG